jgi:hypothetical protein
MPVGESVNRKGDFCLIFKSIWGQMATKQAKIDRSIQVGAVCSRRALAGIMSLHGDAANN